MRKSKNKSVYLGVVICLFFISSVSVANAGPLRDLLMGIFRNGDTVATKLTAKEAEKSASHLLGDGLTSLPHANFSPYIVSQLGRIAAKCVAYSANVVENNQKKELRCTAMKNQFLQCVSVKTKDGLTEESAGDFCTNEDNLQKVAPLPEAVAIKTIQESLREDRKKESYFTNLGKYRNQIGISIPKVKATLSGELNSLALVFPQFAQGIEESQIWFWAGSNVNLVFHNSTGKALDGLAVRFMSHDCDGGANKDQFRLIKFESEVKPDNVVAADFVWDANLPKIGGRCAQIVDVIFK
jgi:hypothetical protein